MIAQGNKGEGLGQNPKALQSSEAGNPEREQALGEEKLERVGAGKPKALEDSRVNAREAEVMSGEGLRLTASGLLASLSGQEKVTFKLGFER